MADDDSGIEDSGLSPEIYRDLLFPDRRWWIVSFLVILGVLSALFYWFSSTTRANSNTRVREAAALIERADTAAREVTPLTLEIEEMLARTQEDRDYILDNLVGDTFPGYVRRELKRRYRRQSALYELPSDWMSNLPPQLERWRQQRRRRRVREVNRFLSTAAGLIEDNQQRLSRLSDIREQLELSPRFDSTMRRYEDTRNRLRARLSGALDVVEGLRVTEPRIPSKAYQALNDLLDPLTVMVLQYRRFSGFTSAPSALVYAEQVLKDALRIDPKNPRAFYQLGRVYGRLGMEVLSSEHFVRALRMNPDFKRREILDRFRTRLDERPDSPRAHYDLAFAYYETGQHAKARSHLEEVLQLQQGQNSMVKVLARKRLRYIEQGEPPYHKMTYF